MRAMMFRGGGANINIPNQGSHSILKQAKIKFVLQSASIFTVSYWYTFERTAIIMLKRKIAENEI